VVIFVILGFLTVVGW